MLTSTLELSAAEFARGTGWAIKPEGACKADVCVPLPDGFSVDDVTRRLGMAIVHDEANELYAIGPESLGDRALSSATAPELVLDDVDGNEFRLSSLRGHKVVIVSWAPY